MCIRDRHKKAFYEAVELAASVQDFIDYDGPVRTAYALSLIHICIGNRSFIVEPVFIEESSQTLGEVLLRLMKSESEKLRCV